MLAATGLSPLMGLRGLLAFSAAPTSFPRSRAALLMLSSQRTYYANLLAVGADCGLRVWGYIYKRSYAYVCVCVSIHVGVSVFLYVYECLCVCVCVCVP
jgi:hypothetical protein